MDEAAFALARPWALALLVLPLLTCRLLPPASPRSALRAPPGVLNRISDAASAGGGRRSPGLGAALAAFGWLALVMALAGPQIRGDPLVAATKRELLFAIDLSASMAEADMTTGAPPGADRLAAARAAAGDFLSSRQGDRVGIIGFATEAYLVAPLTHDVAALTATLAELSVGLPGRRTDLGQAIGLGVKVLRDRSPGDRILVILTDGDTNAGDLAAHDAAALAADADIRVDLVGFAAAIEPASAAFMAEIAALTGGVYREATDPAALTAALAQIAALAPVDGAEPPLRRVEDWSGPPLVLAFVVCLAIAWREWRDA